MAYDYITMKLCFKNLKVAEHEACWTGHSRGFLQAYTAPLLQLKNWSTCPLPPRAASYIGHIMKGHQNRFGIQALLTVALVAGKILGHPPRGLSFYTPKPSLLVHSFF